MCAEKRAEERSRGLFDGYPVPIYTHHWRKGTRESATAVVLVNTGERGREREKNEEKRSHTDGIDSN